MTRDMSAHPPGPPSGRPHGLSEILRDIQTAVYHWTSADDHFRWSANAPELFNLTNTPLPATGHALTALLTEEKRLAREAAIAHAAAHRFESGGRFDFTFSLSRKGGDGRVTTEWYEERGHLLFGDGGKIIAINGSLRRASAPLVNLSAEPSGSVETDPLTGTLTRPALARHLADHLEDLRKLGHSCGLMIACIDNLAVVNDSFGFDVADAVIQETSRRISSVLRNGDLIGRLAGNKFGILLRNCSVEDAPAAAKRFCDIVAASPIRTSAGEVVTTVSVGCVIAPRFASDAEKAITRATEALQEARSKRRAGFKVFEPDTRRDVERQNNLRLATDLLGALSENRLGVALQPIVSSQTDETAFSEALVRVRSRDGEDISASAFMPLADRLGLVQLIDTRMLDLTVEMLSADPDLRLSVNVGVSTALDPDWFERITNHVLSNRDIAERMIIEITETEAIQDIQETAAVVAWMHDLGCKVALDDFGAGYTTYRNLRDLAVDMVKIDGAFMRNLHRSEADQLFVRTLLSLAQNLGIETVAEWVEDERDARLLKEWGVTYLQGHLYGRAVTEYMPGERAYEPESNRSGATDRGEGHLQAGTQPAG